MKLFSYRFRNFDDLPNLGELDISLDKKGNVISNSFKSKMHKF